MISLTNGGAKSFRYDSERRLFFIMMAVNVIISLPAYHLKTRIQQRPSHPLDIHVG